ncbi:LysR family transcriptional regulator [Photobacterium rosenbergii]|uniref:LysR family transcriptional regulator n=1 Tax=Photobacterium rosenbergii TaxID=294936 RepID=A0A2T3NFE6_9GAMM|nr:LysR family transcriptional regulator [Photobacterium rosenbergii]PSW13293.1 LysR family transcriptional regulator [Photobacterium rosenbergii]
MYNLEQLQMFVTAAKLGSFSACARQLGKVQSAVSQGIANLEIDFNVELFDRSTRKPTLTEQGQHLLRFAEATLQQSFELQSAAKALSDYQETEVTILIDDNLLIDKLSTIADEFSQHFPSTTLSTMLASSTDVPNLLLSGKGDLGVMLTDMVYFKELDVRYIGSVKFVPVASPDHPLSKHDSVTPADLIPYRQLMVRGESGKSMAYMPPISSTHWWTNDHHVLIQYVEKGIGWTYLPSHEAKQRANMGRMKILPVTFDHKEWQVPVECVAPKGKSVGPAVKWLNTAMNGLLDDI